MKLNELDVTAKFFAYDGCHKIYLLESKSEITEARKLGYNIYPIGCLEDTYENSCGLRFVEGWKPDFKVYVSQFEKAVFEGF